MKRVLKWLLAGVVVLAAVTVVVLYNPSLAKGPLEYQLSKLAGFPVRLAGDLEVAVGRITELSVSDLHVAAPKWSAQNDLVVIDRLFLSLETSSLFHEAIIVNSLQISGLQANLETGSDGENNWQPPGHRATDESTATPGAIFLDVRLDNVMLKHLDQTDETGQVFYIQTLSQQHRSDDMLDITFNGSLNDRPVEFDGTVGPFENLLMGRDIVYDGQGKFGNLEIHSRGLIDDLLRPRRPQFELRMQGQNIDEITAMLGIDDLGSGNFSFKATGGEVESHYEAGINGKVGDVTLDASVRATDLAGLDELDLTLAANGPNLGAVTRAFGVEHWPDVPFSLNGSATRIGSTFNIPQLRLDIGGTELVLDALLSNFPALDSSRIKLGIKGDDLAQFHQLLGIKGFVGGPFEIQGRLDVSPQQVELLQVDVQTPLAKMTLSGSLGNAPDYAGSRLHLHLAGDDAHRLMSVLGIDALPKEPYSLDAHIETTQNGLLIEDGALVTIRDERLELNGFVSFLPGGKGTDVVAQINGQHMEKTLGQAINGLKFADLSYELSGRVRVLDETLRFDDFTARFADVELTGDGSMSLQDNGGDQFSFHLSGNDFSAIDDSLGLGSLMDVFVPGQAYNIAGELSVSSDGWKLDDIGGRIGDTDVIISGLVSTQPRFEGSYLQFSLEGSNLRGFLVEGGRSDRSAGAFKASARLGFNGNALNIENLYFESPNLHGALDLTLDLPLSSGMNLDFDINLRGNDFRHLVPVNRWFEPAHSEYHIEAAGHKTSDLVSLQHFDLEIGTLAVSMRGGIGEKPGASDTSIEFSASSNDLSMVGRFNGKRLPALPLDIKTVLTGHARQFSLRDFHASLGQSDITGTVDVALHGTKPEISLRLQSKLTDLGPLLSDGQAEEQDEPATQNGRVIPATPLPLAILDKADTDFKLDIDELRMSVNKVFHFVLEGGTENGTLEIPRVSWSGMRGGKQYVSLTVEPLETGAANVKMDLNAEGVVFTYTGLTKGQPWLTPEMDIRFRAQGRGSNLRDLAASMDGRLFVGSEGGIMQDANLSLLDSFILDQVFGLILAKDDEHEDNLVVNCVAAAFDINDGLMEANPAYALTTDKIRLVGKGTLDLKTEKLNFNFNATPNNALKISASELINPYILVGGTLAKPDVGIDPSKVLIHGGAAIGTAGISILAKGVLDRMGATVPSCKNILEQEKSG